LAKRTIFLKALIGLLGFAGVAAAAQQPGPPPIPAFAEMPAPPAPDYASPAAWSAGSANPGASSATPPGATPIARQPKVDVFYIHPSTYLRKDRWNVAFDDQPSSAWTDASVVARQAGVFNGCCRIFSPRYRQASPVGIGRMLGDGKPAVDLAYADVLRAFDYYLAHDNHGRPIILAGHSQGGLHLFNLLKDRIDGKPLQRKLVAAYLLGYNLSEGDFGHTYKTLSVCATPLQTGCVVAWNAELPSVDRDKLANAMEKRFVDTFGDGPGKTVLCVNPLTFDTSKPSATAEQSLGAVTGSPGYGPLQPLVPHAVAAHCEHGFLVVEPARDLDLKPLPGGSMHYHEVGLFYADIRANAIARVGAYLKAHPAK
jgi:hypothetical protein